MLALADLESRVRELHKKHNSSATACALASVLTTGGRIDGAIAVLEKTVRGARRPDSNVLTNLSALYLEKGIRNDSLADFWTALSLSDKAVSSDEAPPEAAFNQAVILDLLRLRRSALDAWWEYRRLDPDSHWSPEVKEQIRLLEQSIRQSDWSRLKQELLVFAHEGDRTKIDGIVERFRSNSLAFGQEELLANWADAFLRSSPPEIDASLSALKTVSTALDRLGYSSLKDSLDRIQSLGDQGNLAALGSLANEYQRYRKVQMEYRESGCQSALEDYRRIESNLSELDPGIARLAKYSQIRCGPFQEPNYAQAFQAFESLHRLSILHPQRELRILTVWMMGLIRRLQGDRAAAILFYNQMLDAAQEAGDLERTATAQGLLAVSLEAIGDRETSRRQLLRALRGLDHLTELKDKARILSGAVQIALRSDATLAAVHLQNELVRVVESWGDPLGIATAVLERSRLHLSRKDKDAAYEDLWELIAILSSIEDPSDQKNVLADLTRIAGTFWLDSDPQGSVELLTRALEHYEAKEDDFRIGDILVERARAYRLLGESEKARRDLGRAVSFLEKERGMISEPAWRSSAYDLAKTVFDDMIEVQLRLNDPGQAWVISEMSRARSLLDALTREPFKSPLAAINLPQISATLPQDTLVVIHAVLKDRLVIWLIDQDGLTFVPGQASTEELRRNVEAFRRRMHERSTLIDSETVLTRLYELLIRPIRPYLKPEHHLVLVPEKELLHLSFAALRDGERGRYLIEDHPISYAPSVAVYSECLKRVREAKRQGPPNALLVGDPAFPFGVFPDLARLPGAEAEVRTIQDLYTADNVKVLVGAAATKKAVLESMGKVEVLHLGAHSVANESNLSGAAILLASTGEEVDSGAFYPHEVSAARIAEASVVVLAACKTASGPIGASEGLSNFARPFLASGASAVVASWGDIEDRSTGALLWSLHKSIAKRRDLAAGLQRAQRELLEGRGAATLSVNDFAGLGIFGCANRSGRITH